LDRGPHRPRASPCAAGEPIQGAPFAGGADALAEADEREAALAALDALELAIGESVFDAETPGDRPPPALPDDYELVSELGRGGMGVVYRAYQRSLDREVAIKVLRPGEAGLGPWMARFVDEARHLARLRHQNIVSVHEIGEAGGEPFFAMDLVKGESLAARLSHGPITTAQALHWALQVGEAVQFAHESGVMHRDLKPANILLDENGRAFVSDFGLARELSGDSSHTRPGEVLGTPAYMAREQALGDSDRIGERSDVHGLAVVIYEMLCGKAPYGCGAPGQVLSKLLARATMCRCAKRILACPASSRPSCTRPCLPMSNSAIRR
jgi:serine/threonine protein kinase